MNRSCRHVVLRLSDYLDHELAGAALLRVEAHLARCPACRRMCHSLARTLELVRIYRLSGAEDPRELPN